MLLYWYLLLYSWFCAEEMGEEKAAMEEMGEEKAALQKRLQEIEEERRALEESPTVVKKTPSGPLAPLKTFQRV